MTTHRRGVFDVPAFYRAVDDRRRQMHISARELCRQAGVIEGPGLTYLRAGRIPSAETLARLLLWLGTTDVAPFIKRPGEEP